MKRIVLFVMFMAMINNFSFAQENHIYSTWDVLELDTCASAWLIKNFVDTQAEFKFYPKGEFISEGIAFDTPDAKFRRTGQASCFETILKEYKINDKALIEIGRMIHEIEVNFWSSSISQQSKTINQDVLDIINSSGEPKEIFKKSFSIFDELYLNIKDKDN